MSRAGVAILVALAAFVALAAAQWTLTSPGVITYGEVRLLTLAAVPALTITLSAYWVGAGRRRD